MPDIYSNHLLDDEDNYQRAKPKNYIVNSDMAVSQENGDGPNNISTSFIYGADEHQTTISTGAGGTLQVSRVALENRKALRVEATVVASNLTGSNNAQPDLINLESGNIVGLNGKSVTYSAKVKTNWAGNLALNFLGVVNGTIRTYVTDIPVISGTNQISHTLNFESNTVDTDGNGLGIQISLGANNEGNFQTTNTNVWQVGIFICSNNSTQWTKTAGNFVEITEVQLTEGDVAPKYQPYTDAFYNSYRYYRKGRFNRRGAALGSGRWQELIYLGHDLRAAGICNLSAISTSGGFVGSNPTLSSLIADLSSLEVSTDFLTPSTADNSLAFEWEVISRL